MDPEPTTHTHRKGDGQTARTLDLKSIPNCRRRCIVVLPPDGRQAFVMPLRCKSWRCSYCGPRIRKAVAAQLTAAGCRRFITLTCDPRRFVHPSQAYERMKHAFQRLVRMIRTRFGEFEYAAVWEWTQRGWPHLHILQRGCFVPQKWLSARWNRLGIGRIVHIQEVTTHRRAAWYITKYLTKGTYSISQIPKGHRWLMKSRGLLPKQPKRLERINRPEYRTLLLFGGAGEVIEHLVKYHGLIVDLTSDVGCIRLYHPERAERPFRVDVLVEVLTAVFGCRDLVDSA